MSFSRRRSRSGLGFAFGITPLVVVLSGRAAHADLAILPEYVDGAGEGFNDPLLGLQRRTAFEHAIGIWSQALDGTIPVVVEASFDALGGTPSSATLAQAGPTTVHRDFSGSRASTWYAAALANQVAVTDANGPLRAEISAQFNSEVDGDTVLGTVSWYYQTDGRPGRHIDFVTVALHEIGHGLGFFDTVEPETGAWAFFGLPDIFGRHLFTSGLGQFDAMTDTERKAAITSDAVVWNGRTLVEVHGEPAPMYAPDPYESGSSVSHFDTSLLPDELLEPFYVGPNHDPGLALPVLEDTGWHAQARPTATATPTRAPTSTRTGTPATPTPSQTPTATVTATATRTSRPTPTATPTQPDTCVADGDCSDGNTCNGAEPCVEGACRDGTPLTCDGRPLTNPFCTDGPDSILGTSGDDVLAGGGGDDTITGGHGNDLLCGNEGRDLLRGNEGNDSLRGGKEADTLLAGKLHDDVRGQGGSDLLIGHEGDDRLLAGQGNDTLDGQGGFDTVDGQAGRDACAGEVRRNCE